MTPTLKELLAEGQTQLRDAGIVNPQLAAEVMLRFLLNLRRIDIYLKEQWPSPLTSPTDSIR